MEFYGKVFYLGNEEYVSTSNSKTYISVVLASGANTLKVSADQCVEKLNELKQYTPVDVVVTLRQYGKDTYATLVSIQPSKDK